MERISDGKYAMKTKSMPNKMESIGAFTLASLRIQSCTLSKKIPNFRSLVFKFICSAPGKESDMIAICSMIDGLLTTGAPKFELLSSAKSWSSASVGLAYLGYSSLPLLLSTYLCMTGSSSISKSSQSSSSKSSTGTCLG